MSIVNGRSDAANDSAALHRHLTSRENRRHLARMPLFRTDEELPDRLAGLLDQIDEADRRAK